MIAVRKKLLGGGRRVEQRCIQCDKDVVIGLVVAGNPKGKRQRTSAVLDETQEKLTARII